MKRLLISAAVASIAAMSALADSRELKVLMIGNSFSASVLHVTPKVAEACGLKVEFVNCNIGGCTLKQHWENIEKASDPEFRPYLAMFGTPDSETAQAVRAVCVDGKTNIPQMLDAARWDVVTIQQGSVGSPFADTYQPYADNLIATIRKHAPQAEILIQETWAYLPYHKKLDEWKMTQREMYERLHENYGALAKKTGFRVIPTGTAVERYRAKLPPFRKFSKAEWDAIEEPNLPDIFGDPCGVPKWRKPYRWEKGFDPGKVQLMIDSTHLNSDGEYLQACVWLSVLCGIDARKIGWTPEGLAPDRAALMRECAHEAVESAAAQPRKEVLASSFGWNPEDATKCLQSAIDSGAAKVVVDRQASEWLVETIRVPSDVELVFADGVVVRAKPGSMAGKTDCLFRVQNASNVVIRGEGRARLAMNRSDYLDPSRYRHSEYRHLLSLRNVSNVTVRNLALEESGGDGVYLLKARNILLEDLVCRGHNRQGTSLIDGGDIVIRNCVFSETKGALPECGMDIEPARSTFSVGRVLVDNCLFCSNNCSGLAINVSHLRENCGAMDVTYRNCRFFDNAQRGIWTIFSGGHGAPVKGRVSFEDCEAWNNRSGPLQVANLESDGVEVRFERCRFDAAGMAKSGSPIVLNNGGVKSDMNNLSFADCTLACPPKTAPVSFGAMTGCGVVPGGVKGVLRIEYTDGTSGSYDFAELERKYVPQPELRRFETGVVDVSKLVAANPDGRPKAAVFAGYRGPFTFLQAVPGPGSYPIRFISKPLGKRRSVAVQVEVFDPAGTPHDAFTVTEQDFVYELKTTARAGTIYRFQVKPSGSRVVLSSETPGHGFAATDRIHWLTGRGEDIYFQARAGAGDVKVELTTSPHEPATAELIAPDGTVVDRCEKNDSGVILCGKRATDAPPEIWRLHVTRFVDDCKIRLGAATTGVYAYDPDMILIERTSPSASVPVANAPAGERLFPADVTNVCITSVSSIIFFSVVYLGFLICFLRLPDEKAVEKMLLIISWVFTVVLRMFDEFCELGLIPVGDINLKYRLRGLVSVIFPISSTEYPS